MIPMEAAPPAKCQVGCRLRTAGDFRNDREMLRRLQQLEVVASLSLPTAWLPAS